MCGIAAFSVPSGVKRNARALAHSLLTQIESRGSHASGFAYVGADNSLGVYKNPIPGSQLPLHELPRNAKAVILHTRYATQGTPKYNGNNHPVISPDRRIALVHNGVISNDHQLRGRLGLTAEHGEVDSLVIPALIAQDGVASLSDLTGYAAVAWLDRDDRSPKIHIAKLKTSPVAYTSLYDGTWVMASTSALLELALLDMGENYGGVFDLAEGRMVTVQNGFVLSHDKAPAMSYSHAAWQRHSNATSGGHGVSPSTHTPMGQPIKAKGSEDTPKVVIVPNADDDTNQSDSPGGGVESYYQDLEEWRKRQAARDERDKRLATKALARMNGGDDEDDDTPMFKAYGGDDDEMTIEDSIANRGLTARFNAGQGFYIVDHEGDMTHYPTLDDLEARLKWLGKMTKSDIDLFQVEEEINWANHVWDMGAVDESGNLISWVEDMADIDDYESPAVRNLQYIREGASLLCTLKGA